MEIRLLDQTGLGKAHKMWPDQTVKIINIFDFKRQHKYKQAIKKMHEIDSNQIDHTQ
jgi:hypothetical protein